MRALRRKHCGKLGHRIGWPEMRRGMRVEPAFVMLGCGLHRIADRVEEIHGCKILVMIGVVMMVIDVNDVKGVESRIGVRVRNGRRGRAVSGDRNRH